MKKNKLSLLFLLSVFLSGGCSVFAASDIPYSISGEMVLEDSSIYNNAGLDFTFYNGSEKKIDEFTIVLYLFDEDGEPPLTGRNNIVLKVNAEIDAFSSADICVSLDKYFSFVPSIPYTVDFFYASVICYEDGSQWTDPFGLKVFQ